MLLGCATAVLALQSGAGPAVAQTSYPSIDASTSTPGTLTRPALRPTMPATAAGDAAADPSLSAADPGAATGNPVSLEALAGQRNLPRQPADQDATAADATGTTTNADPLPTATIPVPDDSPIAGRETTVDNQEQAANNEADTQAGFGRQNDRTSSIDGLEANPGNDPDFVPGFRFGTLTLRPTISEKLVHESIRDGSNSTSRTYSETTVTGTLESDWSRHKLTVDGAASLQQNLSGTGQEEPNANINALLELDLANDLVGRLRAGYDFQRESRTDPNAITGADAQATVNVFTAGAEIEKTLGQLRGTVATEVTRSLYGDAVLADSSILAGDDRDTWAGKLSGRIGYVISPALIPFLEASVQRTRYDQTLDNAGYARSSVAYAAKAGAELDFGEKLTGELAAGYVLRDISDSRLTDIGAFTIDGTLNWSPVRGTILSAGLATTLEAATAAGESGSVAYTLTTGLTHDLRRSVAARLGSTLTYRDYANGSTSGDQIVLAANAGLSWSLSRYLSVDADASFERTMQTGQPDSDTARVGLGLKLRR